jgi:hypothetical protein
MGDAYREPIKIGSLGRWIEIGIRYNLLDEVAQKELLDL